MAKNCSTSRRQESSDDSSSRCPGWLHHPARNRPGSWFALQDQFHRDVRARCYQEGRLPRSMRLEEQLLELDGEPESGALRPTSGGESTKLERRRHGSAIAVDIDHRQPGHSWPAFLEGGLGAHAVPRDRHSDHGLYQSASRVEPFHAGAGDQHPAGLESRQLPQQAMQPGDPTSSISSAVTPWASTRAGLPRRRCDHCFSSQHHHLSGLV